MSENKLLLATGAGVTDTALTRYEPTFEDLIAKLSSPEIGMKDGSYFIRCSGDGRNNNDTAETASILIIDGDSRIETDSGEVIPGAIEPSLVNGFLTSLGVNHCIYSSYSNDVDYHKYRVVIPCEYSREQLPVLLNYLFAELHKQGVMLAPVKENKTWAQAWYFPRCNKDNYGLFQFYQYTDGNSLDVDAITEAWLTKNPAPDPIESPPLVRSSTNDYDNNGRCNPITEFNKSNSLHDILTRNGYALKNGAYIRPGSDSGIPGAKLCLNCKDGVERVYSHGNDVLNDGYAHDPFDVYRLLECGGDLKKALSWNADITKHNQRLYRQQDNTNAPESTSINSIDNNGLTLRSMSDIKMKSIKWLWRGWIPKGYVTLWAGESGAGKTSILADIVARETTGSPWPGETEKRNPGRVLWLGSEDGMADLTKPRLIANSADCSRIYEITPHKNGDSFSLQDDVASAEITLSHANNNGNPFTMLIIDPVTSYLPGKRIKNISSNDTSNVRAILEPWLRLAENYNIAIVCITHFAKDTNRSMMARVLGSTAFVQTCRSLCVVVSLPNDDEPYSKGLLQIKNNLPQCPEGGWRLKTIQVRVGDDEETGEPIEATKPEWIELDKFLTQDNFMTTKSSPKKPVEQTFLKAIKQFFSYSPDGIAEESAIKDAAIKAGVTQSWWKNNNAKYLKKWRDGSTTYCQLSGI